MIRHITCTILLMACFLGAGAQKAMPKYTASNYPKIISGVDYAGTAVKVQCIYSSEQFAGMPPGAVTAIYLRWAQQDPKIHLQLTRLRIGLLSSSRSAWPKSAPIDTFIKIPQYQLDTPVFALHDTLLYGDWIKVNLAKKTFNYTGIGSFVLEMSWDSVRSSINGYGLLLFTTNSNTVLRRLAGSRDDSMSVASGNADYTTYDLGIDQAVVGVAGIENITSFGLFPNPCTDGRFQVSFDTKLPVKEALITVSDAAGRQVYVRQYSDVGSSFFKQVDIRGAAKGLYFLKLEVDGEVISRRVVIE